MPKFQACTQILWSKLWITRARLLQPLTAQGLQATGHFLLSLPRTKTEPFQTLCPEVVPGFRLLQQFKGHSRAAPELS
ncbi:hypothetical protein DWF74_19685 [Pseudomonas protegens]|nr:hypothetical protein DWF74_19685 [Pseudomonas protegens]